MDTSPPDSGQTMQRIKVGATGLAVVLLLIMLASAIFSTASSDKAPDVAGGPTADVVANISITNDSATAPDKATEPLAELGVAPSAGDANSTAPANQTGAVPPPVIVPIQPIPTQPQH
jgi:hypothetical protein